jgi:DNA-binding beta-propeller fold protein YncE
MNLPNRFVPTETAINPANGDIYVADGYGSQYIIQYDSKGRYIRHFGGIQVNILMINLILVMVFW